jgi:hypothetical protein
MEATMEKYKRRLWIIVSVAAIWFALVIWLVFTPSLLPHIAHGPYLFIALATGGIVPICFFPFIANRHPGHALSLTMLAAGIVLELISGIAYLVFDLDNIWIDIASHLGQALILLYCLIVIWRMARKSVSSEKEP